MHGRRAMTTATSFEGVSEFCAVLALVKLRKSTRSTHQSVDLDDKVAPRRDGIAGGGNADGNRLSRGRDGKGKESDGFGGHSCQACDGTEEEVIDLILVRCSDLMQLLSGGHGEALRSTFCRPTVMKVCGESSNLTVLPLASTQEKYGHMDSCRCSSQISGVVRPSIWYTRQLAKVEGMFEPEFELAKNEHQAISKRHPGILRSFSDVIVKYQAARWKHALD